jgi:hypothetical protein
LPAEPIADAQPLFRETPDAFTPLEEAGFQVEEGALRDRAPAIEGEALRPSVVRSNRACLQIIRSSQGRAICALAAPQPSASRPPNPR